MQTAAAYIRVSTEDQIEYSPDSQRKKIQEYAQSHRLLLPENLIFLDEGISGRSACRRPSFMQMIGLAKQKPRPFDLILVWKFSRFARSRQDSILYKSMLRRDCGISVVSITEQLSDDPTSILIEALLEAMDEYYSINLAQEVRRGMSEKFSRGGVVSVPPFGYRMGTAHFEPDPLKSPFIPMIYQNFLNGMSCRQIAVHLNELGIRTVRGNPFESRSVEYILTNPTYTGKLRRSAGGTGSSMLLVDGGHPPLVETDVFQKVQQRIQSSKKPKGIHTGTSPAPYMLHGLVRCSCCGAVLTSAEKGKSLQCHRYAKGLCRQSHHIRLDLLNRIVLSGLKADLMQPEQKKDKSETILIIPDRKLPMSENSALSRCLEQEARRLERIKEAYESGSDSLEEYRENKRRINERIRQLKAGMDIPSPKQAKTAGNVRISLTGLLPLLRQEQITESAKNAILKTFISHITFYRSANAIQIHYRI